MSKLFTNELCGGFIYLGADQMAPRIRISDGSDLVKP